MTETAPLPRAWRGLFALEIPLVGGTVLYWLLLPEAFLADALGLTDVRPEVLVLLFSYVSATVSSVVWLYARLLARPTVHWPTFRLYQEALLVGDVGVVFTWAYGLATAPIPRGPALVSIVMAIVWGAVRVAFLRTARPPAGATTPAASS
ncbi:MAG: hypothetical protein ACK4YP_16210 [Myxococcota bacterium]